MKAPLIATAFGVVIIGVLLPTVREESPETRITGRLELTLATDRESVAPGETMILTTTVRNLTEQRIPFNIAWGQETYFDLGWGLHRVVEKPGNRREVLVKPFNTNGTPFGLVYQEPTHHVLNPRESVSWPTKLRLRHQAGRTYFEVGTLRISHLDVPPGMWRLRWVYAIDARDMKRTWNLICKFRQIDAEYAPCWTGTLKSNDVWVCVVPPVEPPAKAQ